MYKMAVEFNNQLDEKTYVTTLKNGLEVYICKKEGFKKKIGMFGTKYGSITNDFVDITTGSRIVVPEGIAHFLEHKLFEKKDKNMLDVFSSKGISANAYTSFDHTVYYFETITKFYESIELLIKLVREPFFTDENVSKEQGIIAQEIMMYDDEAEYKVFFNMLKAMYKVLPVRMDIAGTVETISKINKEFLYTCYNTFYNPKNMFFVVIGDVDIEETIKNIEDGIKKYDKNYGIKENNVKIEKFYKDEPKEVFKKNIDTKMDIYLEQISIGYKLDVVEKEENLKRKIVSGLINDMFFSKITKFYEDQYNTGVISDEVHFDYEGNDLYSYIDVSGGSLKIDVLKENILKYIDEIKESKIDEELFELVKNNKIGRTIFKSDNLNSSYRRIIDSIIDKTKIYEEIKILESIKKEDLKNFLNLISTKNQVISIIRQK
jgi:predicted Zn-dependent peptidase